MKYFSLPKILVVVIIGVLIARKIIVDTNTAIIISCGFIVFIIIGSILFNKHFYKYRLLHVIVILPCLLAGLTLQVTNNSIFYNYETTEFQKSTLLKVTSTPKLKGKNYRFKCKIINHKNIPNAFVYIRNNEIEVLPKRYDIIQTNKKINLIENSETSTFDFKKYCINNNIAYSIYINNSDINLVDLNNRKTHLFFEKIQESLANRLMYYLQDSIYYSIAAALILGYDQLTHETRSTFSATGAIHVLCVSGLHVSTIFMLITFFLKPLNNLYFRRYITPIITLILLWVYAAITGFSPSVARASFMLSFILIGRLINRDVITINALCGAAIIMIISNPNIIYNVGFQLSFGAVFGIIFFNNEINNRLLKINELTKKIRYFPTKLLEKILGLISVSISVQMLLAPALLYYFKIFPNYFLFANMAAIPLATIILYLGIFLLIISPIEFLASIVGKALYFIIKLLLSSINFIHNIPFSTCEISGLKISQVLLCLIFIFIFINLLRFGLSAKKIIYSLIVIIIFIVSLIIQ
ncbi:MAG: ComEC/Rec2 family competence protein [Bacteroidales bacterium]|jgi:competence protein ComEC|nr:ComEC/Rec2 family competence protein [Bacteroidales bacterium]